jgi:hypothetical protein
MLKKNIALALALTLCMILSIGCASIYASLGTPPPQESSDGSIGITPYSTFDYASQTLSGQQMSYAFGVTSAMPEWRVWMQNTGSAQYSTQLVEFI